MYLKTLTLRGFKSFAEKTDIEFSPSGGIVAIVGPNGCGKSNVVDAIRWVLGELSLKEIRSSAIEDMIFAGTSARKPVSLAEVTLTLDNSDKFLQSDYTEVSIKRRVFRSGESEFFLNKNPCRLKDIRDLFMDTGLGRGAYSIINQGQVDAILSSKPEERRAPFEEAAQISKYRFRKEAAGRKLIATEQNLLRISDIKNELSSQISVLEGQAAKAKEYKEIRSRLKELEVGLCKKLLQGLNERKASQEARIAKLREEIAASQDNFLKIEDERRQKKDSLKQKEEDIEAAILFMEQKISTIEKARRDLEIEIERERGLTEQQVSNEKESEELRGRLEEYGLKLREKEGTAASVSAAFETKEKDLLAAKADLDSLLAEHEGAARRIAEIKGMVFDKESLAVEQRNRLIELEGASRFAKEELSRDEKGGAKLEKEIGAAEASLAEISSALKTEEERLSSFDSALNEKSSARKKIEEYLLATELELSAKKDELSAKASRASVLKGLFEEHQGFGEGVREIIKLGRGSGARVVGVVADLIKVDEKFELSIEAALGQNLQLIITKTDSAAKDLIEHLRKGNLGRATFLPLNLVRGDDPIPRDTLADAKGFVGMAGDFASCDDEIRIARDFLLGRTAVFNSLENALAFFRSDRYLRGLRITTLTGELITPRGIISGGSPGKRTAVHLNRERELLSLSSDVEEAKKAVEESSSALARLKEDLGAVSAEIAELSQEKHSAQIILAKIKHDEETFKNTLSSAREEINLVKHGASSRRAEIEDLRKAKEDASSLIRRLEEERASLEASLKETTGRSESLTSLREASFQAVTELRVETSRLSHSQKTLEEEALILKENIDRINGALRVKAEQDIEGKIKTCMETIANLREHLPKLQGEREGLERALREKKEEKISLGASIEEFEGRIRGAEEADRAIREKISREEVAAGKVEAEMAMLSQTITEEYQTTVEEILASPYEVSNQAKAKEETRSLKDSQRALGDVNLLAIEEFEKSKERLTFIESQYNDLVEARESLRSLVVQLDEKAREAFLETIKVVSENFSRTFADLFEGGEAKLMIIEGKDILDAGIEIIARPSGKKWLSLEALSGGERALTAIAILFSLLKTHPSPFCFLDEVDAALDEANNIRFGRMLKSFAIDSQMVVITHSKRTMAAADALYGVTMEEPGVSKLVSMKLAEVS